MSIWRGMDEADIAIHMDEMAAEVPDFDGETDDAEAEQEATR